MATKLAEAIGEAARILRAQGAREVCLVGSVATGRAREGSDVAPPVSGLPPEPFLGAPGRVRRG